jgi:hypothetical protein
MNSLVRHIETIRLQTDAVVAILGVPVGSETVTPSAFEQHKPFPLFNVSNHGFRGEFA